MAHTGSMDTTQKLDAVLATLRARFYRVEFVELREETREEWVEGGWSGSALVKRTFHYQIALVRAQYKARAKWRTEEYLVSRVVCDNDA